MAEVSPRSSFRERVFSCLSSRKDFLEPDGTVSVLKFQRLLRKLGRADVDAECSTLFAALKPEGCSGGVDFGGPKADTVPLRILVDFVFSSTPPASVRAPAAETTAVPDAADAAAMLPDALRRLRFVGRRVDDEEISTAVFALPAAVSELILDSAGCKSVTSLEATGRACASLKELKALKAQFSGCSRLKDADGFFAGLAALPLRRLELHFRGCGLLRDLAGLGSSLAGLSSLEELLLDLSWCDGLTDVVGLSRGLAELRCLVRAELGFEGCGRLTDLSALVDGLASLPKLSRLKLSVGSCRSLGGRSQDALLSCLAFTPLEEFSLSAGRLDALKRLDCLLKQSLQEASRLKVLELNFEQCSALKGLGPLTRVFQNLRSLTTVNLNAAQIPSLERPCDFMGELRAAVLLKDLRLNLSACNEVRSLSQLWEGIASLSSLEVLTLNVNACTSLKLLDVRDSTFQGFTRLRKLDLCMNGCTQITDADMLWFGLARLLALQEFRLDAGGCDWLQDLDALGAAVAKMAGLRELELRVVGCRQLSHIGEAWRGLAALPGLTRARFDFEGCGLLPDGLSRAFASAADFEAAAGLAQRPVG